MIKSLTSLLKLSPSTSTPKTSPSSATSSAPSVPASPFTLDSFQRSAAGRATGMKLDDGVPSFGGKWTNDVRGFDAPQAGKLFIEPSTSEASGLLDSVARSKATQSIHRAAQTLMDVVGQNSWADHVDMLRTAIGGAATRLAEHVAAGKVSPDEAIEQTTKWQRLVSALVVVPRGARSEDPETFVKINAQTFQHHRAIEAFEGKADLDATTRLVETVGRQVPSEGSAAATAEFSKRLGLIRELSGHTSAHDFLDFASQFPALRDELLPQLQPLEPTQSNRVEGGAPLPTHGMGLLFDEASPTVALSEPAPVTGTQPKAFLDSLAAAFSGPRVSSAESAAAAARALQQGVVSSFSALEDAWGLAGDTSAKRATLDAALAKSGGVMTKELWQAMPAVARDLYRADEVVASFKDNGAVRLTKDGFPIERSSLGGSGEGTFTMFKAPGLNLVVDQKLGGYAPPDGGPNLGNRNLAYIYESKLRVGSDLLEFGRFDREVRVNGRPVHVGANGLELGDGSRLEKLPDGGYRVSTEAFDVDIGYYRNIETGVPTHGLVHKNPANLFDVDTSQPETFLQNFQVRNKKGSSVEAGGLLGQVMTEQSLRAPDLAVEQKRDLWRMNLAPWLASDFANPT